MIFLFWWNRHPVAPIYNSQQLTQGAGDTSLPNDAGTYYRSLHLLVDALETLRKSIAAEYLRVHFPGGHCRALHRSLDFARGRHPQPVASPSRLKNRGLMDEGFVNQRPRRCARILGPGTFASPSKHAT